MKETINRRTLLKSTVALGGAAALGTLGAARARAEAVRLRATWWGSPDRARRTTDVAKLFSDRNPDVTIAGEPVGSDYWAKLGTSMAGRNIADVFQLEPNSLSDYAGRGACQPLDPFVGKQLDVSNFGENMVDLCRARGKIYGVALGLNSFSLFFDRTVFEQAGMKPPTHETTWKQFADMAVDLTKAANRPNYWAAPYGGRYHYVFDVWLRQRGKVLFTEDAKCGFTVDDAKEWFTYWEDLRKRNATVPADVQTLDQNQIESNSLALGKSAMGFTYSNQLVGYQLLTKNKLGITMVPNSGPGTKSGHYYRPALIWSIGATTKNAEKAAAFISFFVNDLEAGKILAVERGVPMSSKVREVILPSLNETERATVDYVSLLADKVSAYPPPAPVGSVEFDSNVMRKVADQIAFGQLSIAEGSQRLLDDGNATLRKAI
jgi:multiple sugar transport system substrate-binding protein